MRVKNNGFRYKNGQIVEGKKPQKRWDRSTLIEKGNILSYDDIKALNACCRRRGIRSYHYAPNYTELGGLRFY